MLVPKASLVLIDQDADGDTQEIKTVAMPEGLDTIAEFEEWLENTLFREEAS